MSCSDVLRFFFSEEVLASDHALWWSPNSQKLLYGGFDDTFVKSYSFPKYGDAENQYDTIETIRYPKVQLHIVT